MSAPHGDARPELLVGATAEAAELLDAAEVSARAQIEAARAEAGRVRLEAEEQAHAARASTQRWAAERREEAERRRHAAAAALVEARRRADALGADARLRARATAQRAELAGARHTRAALDAARERRDALLAEQRRVSHHLQSALEALDAAVASGPAPDGGADDDPGWVGLAPLERILADAELGPSSDAGAPRPGGRPGV